MRFNQTYDFITHLILMLKRLFWVAGLDKGEISEENIRKAKSMLPKSLEKYVERKYLQKFTAIAFKNNNL